MYIRPGKSYPSNWNRRRWAIFRKYNYRCQKCGRYSKGDLHLHHIKAIGRGGNHEDSNLLPLCSECHENIYITSKNDRRFVR